MTVTVGVDLAAEPARTAVVRVRWDSSGGRPQVESVLLPATDDDVVAACAGAARVGVDCPLGWPATFIAFVTAHAEGRPVGPAGSLGERRELLYRATDLWCQQRGLRPLSVAADRIAHAAVRCAALLPRLDPDGDRSGAGRVVECYPAAALRAWKEYRPGYKRDPELLARTFARLEGRVGIVFRSDELRAAVACVDHGVDALVTALVARAADLRRTVSPPDELAETARIEGWIALPTCAPEDLAGG